MTSKIYRLRPHHISLLCCLISARRLYGDNIEPYIRRTINRVGQFEIDLHNSEGVPKEYSEEFVDSIVEYYNELLGNREARLEVVDGIDEVCELGRTGCNRRRASCERGDPESSKSVIYKKLGLKVGGKRKVSSIIDKIERVS